MSGSARSRPGPCPSCVTRRPTRAPATSWRSDPLRHQVTPSWTIELPDDGEGDVSDGGELVVVATGLTIVIATWDGEPGASPHEVLEGLRSGSHPPAREEFEEEGPEPTVRWALLLDEDDDDPGAASHGLYGYVLADEEWLQVAVLFEDASDLAEALHIWRSVRHGPPTP